MSFKYVRCIFSWFGLFGFNFSLHQDWRCITTRAELVHRSRRKPWPQKGTGRARHGNRRTHIFKGGGQCKGPRGPESYFSILPYSMRLQGLLGMLSAKQAQVRNPLFFAFYISINVYIQ